MNHGSFISKNVGINASKIGKGIFPSASRLAIPASLPWISGLVWYFDLKSSQYLASSACVGELAGTISLLDAGGEADVSPGGELESEEEIESEREEEIEKEVATR